MANRIPLIVDTLDDNKIKELPAGDNLDLGNAGLTNVGSVNATDVTINGVSFNNPFSGNYNDLTNKPIIPVVPSAISAFANDSGYLVFGTNTDSIPEGITNLYHSTARVDARIQSANLSSLNNVDPVTSADDGKVVYYNHETQTFKFTNVVTESDDLQSILTRGNTSDKDIVTTGKVYFQNVFATVADLPNPSTYHGMFVHVHGNGKAYYSHAGEWKALQNEGENFTSFSVGADLKERKTLTPAEVKRNVYKIGEVFSSIENLPQPTIAAINGYAFGGGMELALACDFRVMSDQSAILFAFVNIGLGPDGGASWLLARQIGYSRALEIATSGKKVTGQKCLELGLTNRIVNQDEILSNAQEWAADFAIRPTLAIGIAKEDMFYAMNHSLNEAIAFEAKKQIDAFKSHDLKEGVSAFIEKRKPNFLGK